MSTFILKQNEAEPPGSRITRLNELTEIHRAAAAVANYRKQLITQGKHRLYLRQRGRTGGRRLQIIVDTNGQVKVVYVHAANQADRQANIHLLNLKGIKSWGHVVENNH